ncbi:MAG TPA: transcriptional regulator [Desulfotomaculum sp.]|nr:transcriptional regulator [Desulfotomaculum sp.]
MGRCFSLEESKQIFDEKTLLYILENLKTGLIIVDANERIYKCNKSARFILDVLADNVIGNNINEILSDNINKDSIVKYINFIKKPIFKGNKLIGNIIVLENISEIKSLVSELNKKDKIREELETIIESSYDGVAITNKDGITIKVNKGWDRLTGLKREEVMGKPLKELVKSGIFSDSVTMKVFESKKPVTISQKMKSGKQIMTTGSPIFDDNGEIFQVVINMRDVTELNKLKKNLEQTQTLTEKYLAQITQMRLQLTRNENIIAESKFMRDLLDLSIRVARVDSTVLLLGESGVGKEVIARFIHSCSPQRNEQSFIKVNCGAIPEDLLESELFGYEAGAFTGAKKEGKIGMFELADKGVLFLDEIAELPLRLQVKLLHALQEGEIIRVGGTKSRIVSIKIIAATNQDLNELINNGLFREDLYYRLNVVPINIPPLRLRKEDILPLVAHYCNMYNTKYNLKKVISNELMEEMIEYNWPGNVRELSNMVERMVVTSIKDVLVKDDFPVKLDTRKGIKNILLENNFRNDNLPTLKQAVEELEYNLINQALENKMTQNQAAQALGVSLSTFIRKLRKHKLNLN